MDDLSALKEALGDKQDKSVAEVGEISRGHFD